MSLEMQVAELADDVEKLKRRIYKKDEIQHLVWNDLQEELLSLVRKDHLKLEEVREEVTGLKAMVRTEVTGLHRRIDDLEGRVGAVEVEVKELRSEVSGVRSEVSDLREDVKSLHDRFDSFEQLLKQLVNDK